MADSSYWKYGIFILPNRKIYNKAFCRKCQPDICTKCFILKLNYFELSVESIPDKNAALSEFIV